MCTQGSAPKKRHAKRLTLHQGPKQAKMKSHPSQANLRSGRLFFLAAFAFCGAAIATGFCFVYAIQVGLERLAMYHPLADNASISGSLHPVDPFARLQTPFHSVGKGTCHLLCTCCRSFCVANCCWCPRYACPGLLCGRLQQHCLPHKAGWATIWMPASCVLHCWLMTAGACTIRGISVDHFCSNDLFCCAADKGKPDPPRAVQR